VFLGWQRPALIAAADWLLNQALAPSPPFPPSPTTPTAPTSTPPDAPGREVDLSDVLVVVPGSRAGRVLLALLVEAAEARGLSLTPPRPRTPGDLVDAVLDAGPRPAAGVRLSLASPMAARWAWGEALRAVGLDALRALLPNPPPRTDLLGWLRLGDVLAQWHHALAAEGLRFEDVPARAAAMPDWPDEARWLVAARVQQAYAQILARLNLEDPDLRRLDRLAAAEVAHHAHAAGTAAANAAKVALISVVEWSSLQRRALALAGEVDCLIFAPEDRATDFDALGVLRVDRWTQPQPAPPEGAVTIAHAPRDQAERVMAALAALPPGIGRAGVTLGLADPAMGPHLALAADRAGLGPLHLPAGTPLPATGPAQVLRAASELIEDRSFAALLRFIRTPDIERALQHRSPPGAGPAWWLSGLDRYGSEKTPIALDGLPPADARDEAALVFTRAGVRELLGPLLDKPAPRRNLAHHARETIDALARVYTGRSVSPADPGSGELLAACQGLATAADELEALDRLSPLPESDPPTAIALLLAALSDAPPVPEPAQDALEAVGWLELALDPAPATLVVGMNEGTVPARPSTDGMLTDALRSALGLPTAQHRLARDAWIFACLLASRSLVRFFAGQLNTQGDPARPSRFLLGPPGEAQARRVLALRSPAATPALSAPRLAPGPRDLFPLTAPIAQPLPEVRRLSVTAFRAYLRSPLAFYLSHIRSLRTVEPPQPELSAPSFGSLLHEVLSDFAHGPCAASDDEQAIRRVLLAALHERLRAAAGNHGSYALAVQQAAAERRLDAFALWQAGTVADGWTITHAEWSPPQGWAAFDIDGSPIQLSGRIDRIDRHHDGRLRLIDYKTSERPDTPQRTHRTRDGAWTDLQLPLYRHLARELGTDDHAQLGYLVLPNDPQLVRFANADWDQADLADADEHARAIVRQIRAGRFDDPGPHPPSVGTLAYLCGQGLLGADAAWENQA
jgi:RecB family exonuclease